MKRLLMICLLVLVSNVAIAQDATPKRALVIIDVQEVYFQGDNAVYYPEGSLANVALAGESAAQYDVPVVMIKHSSLNPKSSFREGNPLWEVRPELATFGVHTTIIKNYPGSFTGTELDKWLKEHEIDTVVIAGYMTQMCCDTTARQAYHLGYKVEFLSDATGTRDLETAAGKKTAKEIHETVLVVQSSAFSKVMTTAAWIDLIK
jgi:nicotinamidase-related amidase